MFSGLILMASDFNEAVAQKIRGDFVFGIGLVADLDFNEIDTEFDTQYDKYSQDLIGLQCILTTLSLQGRVLAVLLSIIYPIIL